MKFNITKLVKLFLILLISFWLSSIFVKTLANTTDILVDASDVISDVSNNPVGINMNFVKDNAKIINPLKDMQVGSLRYPIGEIADFYLFDQNNPDKPKISLKDPNVLASRFTNVDGEWGENLLTFDKFMSISQSVEAEPFIVIGIDAIAYTGNESHATPEEVLKAAIEWVKYANIVKGYGVKYWEIGNENDLGNDYTNWTAEKYASTVVQFAKAMKAVDPSIKIGANGMTGSKWWDRVMPIVKDDVDFLVTHQYSSMQNYTQWKTNNWSYTKNIEDAAEAVNTYNQMLRINVTENSSHQPGKKHWNNTWKTLHNFEMLGNTIRFAQVDYYHFWVSRWFESNPYSSDISAFDSSYKLMPMGLSLKIWGQFLKNKIVASSNSKTIRSWASYNPEDKSLNVFLLNKEKVSQDVSITLRNYRGTTINKSWVLKGSTPESTDITLKESASVSVDGSKVRTQIKPLSVTIIELQSNK